MADRKKKDHQKPERQIIFRNYLISTGFIMLFAIIYNHFGHGVHSWYMNFAWIWPAIGLALSGVFLAKKKEPVQPGRVFLACSLSTLTVGFLLRGVFEIAGTGSAFVPVFFIAGSILLALSCISLLAH